jgi:hypothetical protein
MGLGLQLMPHTQLLIGADYSVATNVLDDVCLGGVCENAGAAVLIFAAGDLPNQARGAQSIVAAQPGGGIIGTGPASGSLAMALDNFGDGIANMQLTFDTGIEGVRPVPEPETYALLLVGLGVLGIVSRRAGASFLTPKRSR